MFVQVNINKYVPYDGPEVIDYWVQTWESWIMWWVEEGSLLEAHFLC